MDQTDVSEILEEWVRDYCHDDFEDGLPGAVRLFIEKVSSQILTGAEKASESLGDYSVSYLADVPPTYLRLLAPYRKLKMI